MESVTDILDSANSVYYRSASAAELRAQEARLAAAMKDAFVNEKNKRSLEGLLWRVTAKRLLSEYLEGNCSVQTAEEIAAFAEKTVPAAREKGYGNTERIISNVSALVRDISEIISDAPVQAARVRSDDWKPMTSSKAECAQVAAIFDEKAEKINGLLIPDPLFNKGVEFADIKGVVTAELKKVSAFAKKCAGDIRKKEEELFMRGVRELRASTDFGGYAYYPSLPEHTGAVVLNTPFIEEAEIAAVCNCTGAVFEVGADRFAGMDGTDLGGIFARFAAKNAAVLITDLDSYENANKRDIISAASAYGASGGRVFLTDESGKGVLSACGAAYERIPLPCREYAGRVFREEGLLSEGEELPDRYMLMGYLGVNLAVRGHKAGKSWQKPLDWLCDGGRKRTAFVFMRGAGGQQPFLPEDWGDFFEELDSKFGGKTPFDYAFFGEERAETIQTIMESKASLDKKCAMLISYAADCDNSQAQWEKLPEEEKKKRVTLMTQLVMQALGTGIIPDVQFHDDMGFLGKGYETVVGVCCKGGKEILFKNNWVEMLDQVAGTAAHECMHALQHAAERNGWQQWMWEELGITEGRVRAWEYNSAHYMAVIDYWIYRVQIMETDANAFSAECKRHLRII